LLNVAPRTLSDYENDHTRVPDDIVAAMAEAYNAPLLAYYHLKRFSPLGKYLPDLQEPQTHGDMAFQSILARDDLEPAVESIKKIVSDGVIDSGERTAFDECINEMRKVNGKLFSVVAYAEKIGGCANG
jgi:transcriptional regulator with XRE-family HTH domain